MCPSSHPFSAELITLLILQRNQELPGPQLLIHQWTHWSKGASKRQRIFKNGIDKTEKGKALLQRTGFTAFVLEMPSWKRYLNPGLIGRRRSVPLRLGVQCAVIYSEIFNQMNALPIFLTPIFSTVK
jgi:hypothetical protein